MAIPFGPLGAALLLAAPAPLLPVVPAAALPPAALRAARPPAASFAGGESVTALTGGRVFPATADGAIEDGVVVIRGERIEAVGPRDTVAIPEGATLIDARGGTVLPGLIDLHVHVADGVELVPVQLFLAAGVTTVRDAGNLHLRLRTLNYRIERGDYLGPRIVSCGEVFVGPPPRAIHEVGLTDPEEAGTFAEELVGKGARFLELGRDVAPEVARAVAAVARREGIPLAADLLDSRAFDAWDSLELGVTQLDLTGGIAQAVRRPSAAPPLPGESPLLAWRDRDPAREEDLIERMLDGGVALVTGLARFEAEQAEPAAWSRARGYRYLPDMLVRAWARFAEILPATEVRAASAGLQREHAAAFAARYAKAGGRVGTGTGAPRPGVVPGFAMAREVELLAAAGLSPARAIRAATADAATILGMSSTCGTLEAGKTADVLLVEGNPLDDLGALERVREVWRAGRRIPVARILEFAEKRHPASEPESGEGPP